MRVKAGRTVKGCMDILLSDSHFRNHYDFKEICEFIRPSLERHFFANGKTPQVLAFLLVSEVKDLHFGKRSLPRKRDLKARLNLSPASGLWSITNHDSKDTQINCRVL